MRIAISTVKTGPFERVWSGTPYFLMQALEEVEGVDVVRCTPRSNLLYRAANTLAVATGRFGMRLNWEVEPAILRWFTAKSRAQWARAGADVVIAMGWTPLGLRDDDPLVLFWGDATIASRIGRSPHWSKLSGRTRRQIESTERAAFESLPGILMPSNWAASDVVNRYGIDQSKVFLLPFGSNIPDPGGVSRTAPTEDIRLLAVGVEWHRKGMDIAVRAADELRRRGKRVQLDVVGVQPPSESWRRDYVHYHGFINKSEPQGLEKIRALYSNAHVFVLPSRSDPSPMVLGEASAFGLPTVAAGVDGIPERLGESGRILQDSSPRAFADAIESIVVPGEYLNHCAEARRAYERTSDWGATSRELIQISKKALGQRAGIG